jgi:hypothetical protein
MENRDRDKVSRNNTSSTDAGELNRNTSSRAGSSHSDSSAEFGQKIGRSENLNEPSSRSSRSSGSSGVQSSSSDSGRSDRSSGELRGSDVDLDRNSSRH